jgi:hypothetical protein
VERGAGTSDQPDRRRPSQQLAARAAGGKEWIMKFTASLVALGASLVMASAAFGVGTGFP